MTTMHNLMESRSWAPSEVGVSAREAEVLAALAEHLTNAEIGARLFISIRTVESHVSSLLRKLQADDRRALAAAAATVLPAGQAVPGQAVPGQAAPDQAVPGQAGQAAPGQAGQGGPGPGALTAVADPLPSPLTSFIGRVAERAALADALGAHRLITALGPGGVGKTRLALSVGAEVAGRFADGAWFVDLVPVTDPSMIAPAIAAALGLCEHQRCPAEDTVLHWLAGRETLLVLDNCEHLLDGVAVLLERLLSASPRLSVLVTSRARLLVPFEWVFPVHGLAVAADGGGPGDAVQLFLERAAAAGSPLTPEDTKRVAAICRRLDGMALAIELTAARLPSLGLDGIEAGLADRLRLLTGGRRINDRHRSLRSTLDWSYALLAGPDQAVLRRVSVFAAPFTAGAAAAMLAGWPPWQPEPSRPSWRGLSTRACWSRSRIRPGPATAHPRPSGSTAPTGWQTQASQTRLPSRHLSWCLDAAAALELPSGEDGGGWQSAFDQVACDLRSALRWAAGRPRHRQQAHRLAIRLAGLSFARGMPGESQRRYEQAAGLAPDDSAAAAALHRAAGAAEARHFGNDALMLRRAAADAAVRAGDRAAAAVDLARAAELINRGPGLMATRPAAGDVDALLAEARSLQRPATWPRRPGRSPPRHSAAARPIPPLSGSSRGH